jgi:hypothetical protein
VNRTPDNSRYPALVLLAVLGLAVTFVACPPPEEKLPVGDPTAVITPPADGTIIDLGDSIILSGEESALGENSGDWPELALQLSYFWRVDSKPAGSALVDESLVAMGAPAGDDDDAADDDDAVDDDDGVDDDDAADDDDSADGARDGDDDDAAAAEPADNVLVSITPDIQGLYGLTLQVSDGVRLSDVDHVVVQVGGGNACPVADAGVDIIAETGAPVTLDGSNSTDEDVTGEEGGQELAYTWHLSLVPSESILTDGDIFFQGTSHPVVIPDIAGTYILQLRVGDGLCTSLPDYVTVQASHGNLEPIADAGQSQLLTPCSPTQVTLDGTASFDPEGQPLNFAWSFTSVPNGSNVGDAFIDGRFTSSPSFNWDVPGMYTLELRVDDGELSSQPDYVAVQAVPSLPNGAPVAFAGDDILVEVSAACTNDPYGGGACNPCGTRSVVVDASGSYDPDGDQLNYQWDLQSGEAEILGVESITLEVELPQLPVSYGGTSTNVIELGLTVFDCRAADDDFVTITYLCTGY